MLAREGYSVVQAENGRQALDVARAERPDVITCDVLMPQMDGWAVLTALKSDPDLADIPVIMVTIVHERGIGISLGASGFLTKPVDRTRLRGSPEPLLPSRRRPGSRRRRRRRRPRGRPPRHRAHGHDRI